jgi:hypothetical protein
MYPNAIAIAMERSITKLIAIDHSSRNEQVAENLSQQIGGSRQIAGRKGNR